MQNPIPGALVPLGWNDRVLALFNDVYEPGLEPARVVRVERSACAVVRADGVEWSLRSERLPVVGDWIATDGVVVGGVLPRWSELSRPDPSTWPRVRFGRVTTGAGTPRRRVSWWPSPVEEC